MTTRHFHPGQPGSACAPPTSVVEVQLVPMDMVAHWRRCSQTACFLAQFLAMNFENREIAQNTLSCLFNELIENAVRFTADVHDTFTFSAVDHGETITVRTSNLCDEEQAQKLVDWLRRLAETDVEDLFVEQVLAAASGDGSRSGLGFITLAKDHGARLGVKVTEGPREGVARVEVHAILSTDEVGNR